MTHKRGNWEQLSSKVVHRNPYYLVREDEVIKPDGHKGYYHVVETKGSVFVVALDADRNVYLVGLHRYTNDNYSIEIPAGGTDGEEPLAAAQRELHEEVGLLANTWKKLGLLYPANGILSEENHIFLATDLKPLDSDEQAEEGITEVLKVPLDEAQRMVRSGAITDSQTVAALALAAMELASPPGPSKPN